jgi:DNA-binding transcriptional MerR regulator
MSRLMTIKAAAEAAQLSAKTLRSYERAGLLSPQRSSAGHRLYTESDVMQVRRIAAEIRLARRGYLRRRPEAAPA